MTHDSEAHDHRDRMSYWYTNTSRFPFTPQEVEAAYLKNRVIPDRRSLGFYSDNGKHCNALGALALSRGVKFNELDRTGFLPYLSVGWLSKVLDLPDQYVSWFADGFANYDCIPEDWIPESETCRVWIEAGAAAGRHVFNTLDIKTQKPSVLFRLWRRIRYFFGALPARQPQ